VNQGAGAMLESMGENSSFVTWVGSRDREASSVR
jgi:hypothetical protein